MLSSAQQLAIGAQQRRQRLRRSTPSLLLPSHSKDSGPNSTGGGQAQRARFGQRLQQPTRLGSKSGVAVKFRGQMVVVVSNHGHFHRRLAGVAAPG